MSHAYIHGDILASYRGCVSLAQPAFGVMRMIAVLAQGGKNGERPVQRRERVDLQSEPILPL